MTREALLATRTAAWTDEERRVMAHIVVALRPSPRHLADLLDWLDDIGARDGVRPASILAAPTLRRALTSPGSPPDRLKRWKDALRRLRYPRLAAREQAFAAAVRGFDLGHGVAITPPTAFEGGAVTITIRAESAADLDVTLDRLECLRRAGELGRLFTLLA